MYAIRGTIFLTFLSEMLLHVYISDFICTQRNHVTPLKLKILNTFVLQNEAPVTNCRCSGPLSEWL